MHIMLLCESGKLVTIQSLVKKTERVRTWTDFVLQYSPQIVIVTITIGSCWYNYTQFQRRKKTEMKGQSVQKEKITRKLQKEKERSRENSEDEEDDDPISAQLREEMVKNNRVSLGLEATDKQKKELAELQAQIKELEGRFGNDMGGMLAQLQQLQEATS